jgi:D-serine deaminase-like pyridoxal phosphate-dependent protein
MPDMISAVDELRTFQIEGFARPPAIDRLTPYIEVDEVRLDRNLAAMQARADRAGVRLRPHIKTHKSLEIARRQIALGAVGLTAAKPSEARIFVEGSFPDITLAYPIVTAASLDDLLESAGSRGARIACVAADAVGVAAVETAAARHRARLACYLKVDVGLGRVGVKPDDPNAVAMARLIADSPHLAFAGLLSHAGHVYAATGNDGIAAIAAREAQDLLSLRQRLDRAGLDVPQVSTGSTPTVLGAPIQAGAEEIRPGNYAFLDLTALRLNVCRPDDLALSLITRVVAVNGPYAIIDAGSKALSSDLGPHSTGGSGYGIALAAGAGAEGMAYKVERLSEEHGFVSHKGNPPSVGSLLRIFPNHSCAVVAQFDRYVFKSIAGEGSLVPIDARGRFD